MGTAEDAAGAADVSPRGYLKGRKQEEAANQGSVKPFMLPWFIVRPVILFVVVNVERW